MFKINNDDQTYLFKLNTELKEKDMGNIQTDEIDVLEFVETASEDNLPLEIIRMNNDESAIIPFTSKTTPVDLHFCPEGEINGYVKCNGGDCVLCRIGRKIEKKLLAPVYNATSGVVGILPISHSLRPYALLPQYSHVLKSGRPMVMFVKREGAKYTVSTTEVGEDVDVGEVAIKQFLEEYKAGMHDFSAVYPKIGNEELGRVDEIARMMALKGIKLDAGNKRSEAA